MTGLGEGLSECQNSKCKQPLVLLDYIKENKFGLASVLSIPCRHCSFINIFIRIHGWRLISSEDLVRSPVTGKLRLVSPLLQSYCKCSVIFFALPHV